MAMNLKHLRYFWAVAHAGSLAQAARQLHLTPQTLSGQIKLLEDRLGTALFRPIGRNLELTDAGRVALSYADEMFVLGDELVSAVRTHARHVRPALHVGVCDVVPKSLAFRLLAPLRDLDESVRLVCREGQIDWLLAELALHHLDMVVSDRPMPPGLAVKGHSHKLGESAVAFFAVPALIAGACAFPECLNGAPLLLPGPSAAVRGELERWMAEMRLSPLVMGEFDDGALMKAFAQQGAGFFPAPANLATEISTRYGVREVGRVESIRESFWLISTERRIRQPAVRAILDSARTDLFSSARKR